MPPGTLKVPSLTHDPLASPPLVHQQVPVAHVITQGGHAADPKTLALARGHLVADALTGDLALELRGAKERVERQA